MSRMIAAFEALPHSVRLSGTSLPTSASPPTSNDLCFEPTERKRPKQPALFDSRPTFEPDEVANNLHGIQNELEALNPPRMELVHCCEEISEQLLQIRDELQIGDSAAGAVQLRVFGA